MSKENIDIFLNVINKNITEVYNETRLFYREIGSESTLAWYNRAQFIKNNNITIPNYQSHFDITNGREYCKLVREDIRQLINDMNINILTRINNENDILVKDYLGLEYGIDLERSIKTIYKRISEKDLEFDTSIIINKYSESNKMYETRKEFENVYRDICNIINNCKRFNEFKNIDEGIIKEKLIVLEKSFKLFANCLVSELKVTEEIKTELYNKIKKETR